MKAYPDTNIFIFGIADPVSESATILECAGMLVVLLAGATWVVDDDGGADFTSVRAAVDMASAGDTIEMRSGSYRSVVWDQFNHHKISQHSWNSLKAHSHLGEMPILCKNTGDSHLGHDHH